MASNEGGIRCESLKSEECIKFEFNWTIENFLEAMKDPDGIDSPNFDVSTNNCKFEEEPACSVTAYVRQEEDSEDYLCEYFSLGLYEPYEAYNEYEVSVLGADGQKLNTKTFELAEFESRNNAETLIPLKDIVERQDIYLPNGNLTLHYEGKAWLSLDSSEEEHVTVKTSPDSDVTAMIMKNLFESGNYSDVTIKAGSRKLKCHKYVLSIRSEYFRAMFESGMKESQEGVVDLSDQMDGDVLKDLLEYLYLGMASNLERTCQKMLKFADMFQLDDLKSQSEEVMISQLCPDNAWDFAVLARDHGAKKLLKKAISLFYKCL